MNQTPNQQKPDDLQSALEQHQKLHSTANTISRVSTILIAVGFIVLCCIPLALFMLQR